MTRGTPIAQANGRKIMKNEPFHFAPLEEKKEENMQINHSFVISPLHSFFFLLRNYFIKNDRLELCALISEMGAKLGKAVSIIRSDSHQMIISKKVSSFLLVFDLTQSQENGKVFVIDASFREQVMN